MKRTVEIEILQENLAITAIIYFDENLEFEEKYTEIIEVADLEKNEGNRVEIKDVHYDYFDKHFETNDVFEEL